MQGVAGFALPTQKLPTGHAVAVFADAPAAQYRPAATVHGVGAAPPPVQYDPVVQGTPPGADEPAGQKLPGAHVQAFPGVQVPAFRAPFAHTEPAGQ